MPATPMLQERAVVDKVVSACISGGDEGGGVAGSDDIQPETEEFGLGCRKSKRQKNPPSLYLEIMNVTNGFSTLQDRRFAESNNPRSSIDYSPFSLTK